MFFFFFFPQTYKFKELTPQMPYSWLFSKARGKSLPKDSDLTLRVLASEERPDQGGSPKGSCLLRLERSLGLYLGVHSYA